MKINDEIEQLKKASEYKAFMDKFEFDDDYKKYLDGWEERNRTIVPWRDSNGIVPWEDNKDTTYPWNRTPHIPDELEKDEMIKRLERLLKKTQKKRVVQIKCSKCKKVVAIVKRRPFDNTDEKLLCPICYKLNKLKE